MNLLDTGVNHEHIGQPHQTNSPVATVDANVLSTYIYIYTYNFIHGARMTRVLIGAGTFWRWNRFKIVHIQRFLTLPTPDLSHPTASLGWLLCGLCGLLQCGLCGSQTSRFPIYPMIKNLVGHVDVPCLEPKQKYQQVHTPSWRKNGNVI